MQLSCNFVECQYFVQGLSCGICDMFSSCTGCHVKDLETIQLKPGTCITVHFNDNISDVIKTVCEIFLFVLVRTYYIKFESVVMF